MSNAVILALLIWTNQMVVKRQISLRDIDWLPLTGRTVHAYTDDGDRYGTVVYYTKTEVVVNLEYDRGLAIWPRRLTNDGSYHKLFKGKLP